MGVDVDTSIDPHLGWVSLLVNWGPMLETLDHTIRTGSTPTFLFFDLYFYSAYAAHYIYFSI